MEEVNHLNGLHPPSQVFWKLKNLRSSKIGTNFEISLAGVWKLNCGMGCQLLKHGKKSGTWCSRCLSTYGTGYKI